MARIKEIIVVEGKSDTQVIQQAVVADTLETNGSALAPNTLAAIKTAAETRGIIVFTDPDFNGERLRKLITAAVPSAKHAFLTKDEAGRQIKHHSLGIEYATPTMIQQALAHVQTVEADGPKMTITRAELNQLGLLAGPNAARRRELVAERLQLGYVNGKQLLKRLALFGVDLETLTQTTQIINEENQW